MKIGFVGIGPMGLGMARRLLDAGHMVSVHNRTEARARPVVDAGARWSATPADAARDAELVFSMLADDDAVETMTLGPDGIAAGLAAGAAHVSSSTISVALSGRLAAAHGTRGQGYLSATVLGRPPAAAAGELFVVVAGDLALQQRATPALEAMGQRIFRVGDDPTRANLVKLSLNFLIFSTIEQMSEIFALNDKAGLPPAELLEILTGSFFNAPVHRNYGRLIVERAFDPPGGPMTLAAKDARLFLEAGNDLAVPLPMGSLIHDRLLAAIARGEGGLDFAALSRRAREDAGLPD
ncbi:NAD(P)-dependent oxidoreductase [Lichenicola sp.]|uniref:NAD(P)-dependent oxidoreductase n=1 Tax=Lichenicola sp. TaxID=2804529 RepID=UPI003B000A7A